MGSIPGLGISPGEENSYPFQYSGLENSMNCIVHIWGHKELDTTEKLLQRIILRLNIWASLVGKLVKNLPAVRETWV